ncbi:cholesterol 7-desaturase nvd-like isoform X1 [Pezoporus flaviventris]|uniref:cholesterol 7-desaturase nvd-like isoform X1 n=1 Tax=Pezoporus flaviventris TaxID=889875 RepID=UPI002AB19BA4|nr:cholesterol 7-desaturase nvd-like isoform X1 [Pezoporus flaviventris]
MGHLPDRSIRGGGCGTGCAMGSGWCGAALLAAGPGRGVLLFLLLLLLLVLLLLLLGCCRPLSLRRGPGRVGYVPCPGLSRPRRARRPGAPPPPFPNGWYRLLDSEQLPRGAARSLALLGEQLAVFRTQDGQAFVVDAYCPHLGANLAAGGRVVGNCIECPFHGWRFRGEDGKCTSIPYVEKVPDLARVRTWPCCEVNGMLLLWYHCEGLGPTWAVPEQREITTKQWVFRGQTEHVVDAHIQEIPENAADSAHLAFLHGPAILGGSDLRYTRSKLWDFMKHNWKAEWWPEPEPNKHCSRMLLQHTATVFGKHFSLMDLTVSARQVGPGLVFLLFEHTFLGRGIILQTVTPLEPLLQSVVHKIYYQKNIPAIIPKFILRAECIQFERDITIWNNKQYLPKPLLVREDSSIQKHRRWYSQFYSEKSKRPPAPKDLEW